MYSIATDAGKYRTYGIVERDGKVTKEGYMPTTKEGFQSFMDGIDHATVIVECYGSAYVQTTRAWRNTYIEGESREGGVFNLLPIPEVVNAGQDWCKIAGIKLIHSI